MTKFKFLITCLSLLLLNTSVRAEQSENIGEYTVHYVAVNSSFITPEIANEYNIVRGERRAFLNISILKNLPNGSTEPVTAVVTGGKRNLLGQAGDIPFVQVNEGEAIYYLGQFEFSNAENVRFKVEVQPEASGRNYTLEWATRLYNN